MEAIDRYVLVGLLDGSANWDQIQQRASNVAGEEISREAFEGCFLRLIGDGFVRAREVQQGIGGIHMRIMVAGREALYADLRREMGREDSRPAYQPERRILLLLLTDRRKAVELQTSTRLDDMEFARVIAQLVSIQAIFLDRDGLYAITDLGLHDFMEQIGAQPPPDR